MINFEIDSDQRWTIHFLPSSDVIPRIGRMTLFPIIIYHAGSSTKDPCLHTEISLQTSMNNKCSIQSVSLRPVHGNMDDVVATQ